MRHDQVLRHGQPGHANSEHRGNISQEGDREPSQHCRVSRITHEHFEEDGDSRKRGNEQELRSVNEKSQRRRHGSEIGADIDDVGNEEQPDQRVNQQRRIMAAHIAGEALAGNAANLRADHLNCAHQRIGEQERPGQGVAELRASLRIGGYATGIVVRGAGDEAGPHNVGELRPVRLFDLIGGGSNIHLKDSAALWRFPQ